MIPRKDYEDYSRYINEQHAGRKDQLNAGIARAATTARVSKTSMHKSRSSMNELMTSTGQNFFKTKTRGFSFDTTARTQTPQVKPRILESKVSENPEFYNLSDGFKRIFGDDKKDQKVIVPVVGYGGHRRGDRSQNYFGKSFRDTTIQSKCLERNFRSN